MVFMPQNSGQDNTLKRLAIVSAVFAWEFIGQVVGEAAEKDIVEDIVKSNFETHRGQALF